MVFPWMFEDFASLRKLQVSLQPCLLFPTLLLAPAIFPTPNYALHSDHGSCMSLQFWYCHPEHLHEMTAADEHFLTTLTKNVLILLG